MNYEIALPPMPRTRTQFGTIGPGGTGLLGYVLEHDGEYIRCICDNWPFPQFSFTRGFNGSPVKKHPAAVWKVVMSPNYASHDEAVRQSLNWGDEPLRLPLEVS